MTDNDHWPDANPGHDEQPELFDTSGLPEFLGPADDSPLFDTGGRGDTFDASGAGYDSNRPNDVTENRTENFNLGSGRFHDPTTGEFEIGSPPPEYGEETNRYRANNGQFKSRPADHYDEPLEARRHNLRFPD